ncbi:hypothetical protein [Methylobacterium oryzihabitans]|uniref:hypothetical protein n=1 Tax=Methylobacterium oryzihabitans TaxID=2499852 RepID=UPI0016526154|nr:hypothetical protein [Methylobacterium oryzihabitans]
MGRRGKGAGGAVLLVALAGILAGAPVAVAAQLVAIEGREQRNFGRIALTFDRGVKVTAKLSGTVLVLSFREPAPVRAERLAAEMPAYVGQVRRDPDGSGLRLALQQPLKVNVLEAGERVFVDLLPETWSGLPPGLPPDVVADLARRAAEAEARLRQEARRAERPVPLRPEVAELRPPARPLPRRFRSRPRCRRRSRPPGALPSPRPALPRRFRRPSLRPRSSPPPARSRRG